MPRASIPDVIHHASLLAADLPDWWLGDVAKCHEAGIDGAGEVVAVLGTGLDLAWSNTISRKMIFSQWDENGHESACVYCVHRVAPQARLIAIKCLDANGGGDMSDCVRAVDQATGMSTTVLNGSWGGSSEYPPLTEALKRADAKGILSTFAAGNEGPGSVSFPAIGKYSWSAGAHDQGYRRASFSSRKPDACAGGVQMKMWGLNGGWQVASGTSFACPLTAGAMALWRHAMRKTGQTDLSGSVWASDVAATCRDMDAAGRDDLTGDGAIQFWPLIKRVLDRVTVPVPPKPPIDAPIYIPAPPAGKRWRLVAEDVGVSST